MIERPIGALLLKFGCALGACGFLPVALVPSLAAAEDAPIALGAVLPLTGDAAHWGIPARNGAELAVAELNDAGGLGGRKLKLVVEDDRCQPADGIAAFDAIMARAKAPAVVGAVCSSVTLAIAPLAELHKTALISPASTSPKVTDAGDFVFRVIPSGDLRGKVFADYLYHQRGLRKIAVLYIDNEGGIGGSNAFKTQFTRLGGTIVLEAKYAQGATDLGAELNQVKASDAEGLMVGSYPPDTVVVLRQARELALRQPLFLLTEAVQNPQVLREANDAANGVTYIIAAPATGEAPDRFARAYEAKFGKKPELFAAEGYDAVRLVADAIAARAGKPVDGADIRDFLYRVRDYAGASGTITFDRYGDISKPFAIRTIAAGSPQTLLVK